MSHGNDMVDGVVHGHCGRGLCGNVGRGRKRESEVILALLVTEMTRGRKKSIEAQGVEFPRKVRGTNVCSMQGLHCSGNYVLVWGIEARSRRGKERDKDREVTGDDTNEERTTRSIERTNVSHVQDPKSRFQPLSKETKKRIHEALWQTFITSLHFDI